jgi:hypothetical protein
MPVAKKLILLFLNHESIVILFPFSGITLIIHYNETKKAWENYYLFQHSFQN